MARRKYSDREKAQALAVYDACGNVSEVERITGIPDSTLHQWIKEQTGLNDDIPDLREFKKLELSDKLERIAHQCAGLLPERLPKANVREIVGAMGQSIEKSQLLRGRPTEITSESSHLPFLNRRIAKLAQKSAKSLQSVELELQTELADRSDEDYSAELDARVHPECWPSGNLLDAEPVIQAGDQ